MIAFIALLLPLQLTIHLLRTKVRLPSYDREFTANSRQTVPQSNHVAAKQRRGRKHRMVLAPPSQLGKPSNAAGHTKLGFALFQGDLHPRDAAVDVFDAGAAE